MLHTLNPRLFPLEFLDGKIARWWMPDDVLFVDENTAAGHPLPFDAAVRR